MTDHISLNSTSCRKKERQLGSFPTEPLIIPRAIQVQTKSRKTVTSRNEPSHNYLNRIMKKKNAVNEVGIEEHELLHNSVDLTLVSSDAPSSSSSSFSYAPSPDRHDDAGDSQGSWSTATATLSGSVSDQWFSVSDTRTRSYDRHSVSRGEGEVDGGDSCSAHQVVLDVWEPAQEVDFECLGSRTVQYPDEVSTVQNTTRNMSIDHSHVHTSSANNVNLPYEREQKKEGERASSHIHSARQDAFC